MKALIDVKPTPEQLALFSRIKPGVEVIRGAAGSGKTTTALLKLRSAAGFYLNRMKRATDKAPVRVLILTFNRTLKGYIEELAKQQFKEDGTLLMEVSTFSSWAVSLTNARNIIDHADAEQVIDGLGLSLGLENSFKSEELHYVLGRFPPNRIDDYYTARRVGRGALPRMPRAMREAFVEEVVIPYKEYKENNGLLDWSDLANWLAAVKKASYDVVVVDETQDFSANELRAVLNQVSEAHTVTFVLDTTQRIYARSGGDCKLSRCRAVITKELLSVLAGCGWACKKDDAGDYYCLIEKYDFTVQIIPSLHARRDHIRASLMPSVSTADFSFAVSVILGEDIDFVPIINSNLGVSKLNSIGREEVERLSSDALEWASVQNLSEGLARYRELPPDSKGDLPVRHLAALALDGRVQKLREYMEGFERGERMGFVPYISLQMIGRAFELAVKVKSNNSDS